MKLRELGEKGSQMVKRQIASALASWEPRGNKPIQIVDVQQDMQTDEGGTLQVVVKTRDRKQWKVRINHGTFVEAALC